MLELVKLRQQQLNTKAHLQAMEERLQGTEKRQRQMMSFLARAMQNPAFLQQLAQQNEKRKELEEAMTKKRRRPIDQMHHSGGESSGVGDEGMGMMSAIKSEPLEFGEYGFGVSELEALALEMQGYGRSTTVRREKDKEEEELELPVCADRELDQGFWEELLTERFEGELDLPGSEDDEDVAVLANRLGYLGSSPK